jgi:hypothetical protein
MITWLITTHQGFAKRFTPDLEILVLRVPLRKRLHYLFKMSLRDSDGDV